MPLSKYVTHEKSKMISFVMRGYRNFCQGEVQVSLTKKALTTYFFGFFF